MMDDERTKFKKNFSTPLLSAVDKITSWGSFAHRKPMRRMYSETDAIFGKLQPSPLHDLAPLAYPGLGSRVTHNNSVALSLDQLGAVFIDDGEASEDQIVVVEKRVTAPLVWATFMAVLCSIQFGWNNANMNTPSAAMRADLGLLAVFPETNAVWGLIVAIFCLGGLMGCMLGATVADAFGRKGALLSISATFAVGGLLQAASAVPGCAAPPCSMSSGVVMMMLGRVVVGVASGATTVVVPMYLGEISLPHLRGALGTIFQLTCVTAMLAAQVLGIPALMGRSGVWPWYLLLNLLPAALQFALQHKLPESPRWLAGRTALEAESAESILALLRGVPVDSLEVMQELDFMQQGSGKGNFDIPGYKPSLRHLLRDRSLRRSLTVCVTTLVVQQFSGINNAFNFSSTFLSANGIPESTVTLIAVLMNVGNVVISLFVVYLMDELGRRPLIVSSTVGMICSIFVLTVALTNAGHDWTAPLAVCAVVGFVTCFGIGMGPVPWLLPAEVFPMELSAIGSAISASSNWLANFVVGLVFLPLASTLGGFCFLPFAFVLGAFLVFVYYRIPETRGKTVEQIVKEINN